MLFKHIPFLLFVLVPYIALAQNELKRSGEYTYYVPQNESLERAKEVALLRARMQVLADAFGTKIEQRNQTLINSANGSSQIDFQSFGESELGGEWVADLAPPQFNISYEQGMLIVNCQVAGRIRKIQQAKIHFDAKVLRNGTDDRYESAEFRHNDDLFLSFRSPVSGFLAVYLCDESRNVIFLSPYNGCEDDRVVIKARQRYVLYSSDHPLGRSASTDIRNYTMTCMSDNGEQNQLYIIFSPNPFANVDYIESEGGLHVVDYQTFQRWLGRSRREDPRLAVKIITISINK